MAHSPIYTFEASGDQMRAMLLMSAEGPQTPMRLKLNYRDLPALEDQGFVEKHDAVSWMLTELGERFVRIT